MIIQVKVRHIFTNVVMSTALYLQTVMVSASPDAKRLYDDLLRKSGYSKLIRPVGNNTDVLLVHLGLRLTQIIDVVSSSSRRMHFIHLNEYEYMNMYNNIIVHTRIRIMI